MQLRPTHTLFKNIRSMANVNKKYQFIIYIHSIQSLKLNVGTALAVDEQKSQIIKWIHLETAFMNVQNEVDMQEATIDLVNLKRIILTNLIYSKMYWKQLLSGN